MHTAVNASPRLAIAALTAAALGALVRDEITTLRASSRWPTRQNIARPDARVAHEPWTAFVARCQAALPPGVALDRVAFAELRDCDRPYILCAFGEAALVRVGDPDALHSGGVSYWPGASDYRRVQWGAVEAREAERAALDDRDARRLFAFCLGSDRPTLAAHRVVAALARSWRARHNGRLDGMRGLLQGRVWRAEQELAARRDRRAAARAQVRL